MKQIKLLIVLALWSMARIVAAQSAIQEAPLIEVTGIAEKDIVPDEIHVAVTIQERYQGKTKITLEEQEEQLKKRIMSLGIDLNKLSLNDADADYLKISWRKRGVLTKKTYSLKLEDAETVGRVFRELDSLNVADAYISRISHSKTDSLRREVRILAIQAAKSKADYLLQAIGEKTGKPLIIRETEAEINSELRFRGSRSDSANIYIDGNNANDDSDTDIEFRKIKIRSSIYVKFAIE